MSLQLHKWHPRHWLLPLTMLGLSIMTVFILKTFIPHPGYMLPTYQQVISYTSEQGFIGTLLLLDWGLFWTLLVTAALLIPLFLFKSIQFLRIGAHRVSDKNVMETAGWFGIPLSLAMFANVSAFASVMFFELNTKQDDILWPFWMAMNLLIALMALGQYIWYRQVRKTAENKEQFSMVVPFALGFMGLNLAGPGAFTANSVVATISISASLFFIALSMFAFLTKIPAIKEGFKQLWVKPKTETEQQVTWGHQVNLATGITAVNVWQIAIIRNYLNYGHNFGDFSFAFKNSLTWGLIVILPLVFIVILSFMRSGFFNHLLTASKNYLFSLGQICMFVSSYVLLTLFSGTAVKAGLIVKYGLVWNLSWTLGFVLATLTLLSVGLLLYRMVILNNIKSWQEHEVAQLLKN
ncbi:hypothetical protein JCM30760_14920 [Thiomicrorhabdus hydrogeniphila]